MKHNFTTQEKMQPKWCKILIAFALISLSFLQQINAQCSCTGSSGNLLTNPSFETSGGAASTTGWTKTGRGTFSSTTGYEVCGSRYGLIDLTSASGSGPGTVYQDVTGIPVGTLITLNIWAGVHTQALSCAPTLKLMFLNSSNVEIAASTITATVDRDVDTYTGTPLLKLFTLSNTVPAGATSVRVQASVTCNYLKLDGACLSYNILNLGNRVFYDPNNNGIFDATEHGMDGFTVNLYQDANDDNVADGAAIQTTVTANGGFYNFTNLNPGNYIVGVVNTVTDLASSTGAGNSTNPDNNVDNDDNGVNVVGNEIRSNAITITPGAEPTNDGDGSNGNLTLDFGLRCTSTTNGCGNVLLGQGNFIWKDLNGNGLKDANEPGVPNVTVKLYKDANGDNVPDFSGGGSTPLDNLTAIQTTTTNAQGVYAFTANVTEGRYILGITLPVNYVRVLTNSNNPDNDIDNDNNGTNQVGNEVFSNGVTLNYYMEPGAAIDNDNTNNNSTVDFAIALTGSPTPINFTALSGEYKNGISYLTWATLQESNSSHFEVERSSDGFSYTPIGNVAAKGTSTSKADYLYNDVKATVGNNYYRLKMLDKDGSYKYSNVVVLYVKLSGTVLTKIYPNPFVSKIEASVLSDKKTTATIMLYDFAGKLVANEQQVINKGANIITLNNLQALQTGYYTIKIQTNESVLIQKVLK